MSGRIAWLALPAILLTSCVSPPGTADRTISHAAVYTGRSPAGYIPPGTVVAIRTKSAIQADTANVGKTFPAELVRDLVGGNGTVLAAAGSEARLVVLEFTEGGKTTSGQVQLGLAGVAIHGRLYPVRRENTPGGPLGALVERSAAEQSIATKGFALAAPAGAVLMFQSDEPMYLRTG